MTTDTETIREALEEMCPYLERKVASFPDDGFARLRFERAATALTALGRVEERAREMEQALAQIVAMQERMHPVAGYMFDSSPRKIARAALAGSVAAGSGEERE